MKTALDIINEKTDLMVSNFDREYEQGDVLAAMEEYAEQFKPKWIPVSERLPKGPDIVYLVAVKNKNKEKGIPLIDIAVFDSDGIWQKTTVWEDVTHWMNLPEAP